jgi:hypothetical protein
MKRDYRARRAVPEEQARTLIRRDIRNYAAETKQRETVLRTTTNDLLKLDRQEVNTGEVVYGCRTIGTLLDTLVNQTQMEEPIGVEETAAPEEVVGEQEEVNTLRTLASDDTSLETTSVSDYSANPPSGPTMSDTSVHEAAVEMASSNVKIGESLDTMRGILQSTPQWWQSPIVMRRLKTHSIRMNYHSRKIKKWGNQARSQIFVGSSLLNRAAQDATAELNELRTAEEQLQERKEKLHQRRAKIEIARETARIEMDDAVNRQCALDDRIVAAGLSTFHTTMAASQAEAMLLTIMMQHRFPDVAKAGDVVLAHLATVDTTPTM